MQISFIELKPIESAFVLLLKITIIVLIKHVHVIKRQSYLLLMLLLLLDRYDESNRYLYVMEHTYIHIYIYECNHMNEKKSNPNRRQCLKNKTKKTFASFSFIHLNIIGITMRWKMNKKIYVYIQDDGYKKKKKKET